jgi:hypothetical protein
MRLPNEMDKAEKFTIKNTDEFITISINEVYGFPIETCHWGGYDTKSTIEIEIGSYNVKSLLYISTGDIYTFYRKLIECHRTLKGEALLESYEKNLRVKMTFNEQGHVNISGYFREYSHSRNELTFEMDTDQSYLNHSISELSMIAGKYGDLQGAKN